MDDPRHHNRLAWDHRARRGETFTKPVSADALRHARLSPDPWAAAESIKGKQVLCLAAGGGRQAPVYAAAGGNVTVVDISDRQLDLDRHIAADQRLPIRAVCTSMDDLSALGNAVFDIVIQPVSTCYLPDIAPVYRQVAHVIKPGGLYISQHKQPVSLQSDIKPSQRGYEIVTPADHEGPLPQVAGSPHREHGTLEYLHSLEQIVGGLCRAGFAVEDLTEPPHGDRAAPEGSFAHRWRFVNPYLRLKARRNNEQSNAETSIIIA